MLMVRSWAMIQPVSSVPGLEPFNHDDPNRVAVFMYQKVWRLLPRLGSAGRLRRGLTSHWKPLLQNEFTLYGSAVTNLGDGRPPELLHCPGTRNCGACWEPRPGRGQRP